MVFLQLSLVLTLAGEKACEEAKSLFCELESFDCSLSALTACSVLLILI